MKVSEVLEIIPGLEESVIIREDASLEELASEVVKKKVKRNAYVIDSKGRLIGYVPLKKLANNLLLDYLSSSSYKVRLTRSIIDAMTSEKVGDITIRSVVSCRLDEDVEEVIERLLEMDIEEMPVIDADGKIVARFGLTNILELWLKEREKQGYKKEER